MLFEQKWKKDLKRVIDCRVSLNRPINPKASEGEIARFLKTIKEKFDMTFPDNDYLTFLRTINGIQYNGQIVYGIDDELCDSPPPSGRIGFIDYNETWYDNEWNKQYIFFGDGDISWYVYDLENKKYLELDKPSGDEEQEFEDFWEMLDFILRSALDEYDD